MKWLRGAEVERLLSARIMSPAWRPASPRLKRLTACSETAERPQVSRACDEGECEWWSRAGSNRRPLRCERSALPKLSYGPTGENAPALRRGALDGYMLPLSVVEGLNRTVLDDLTLIASPVAGLRPLRAARVALVNVPRPLMRTFRPFFKLLVVVVRNVSKTRLMAAFGTSGFLAAISSSRSLVNRYSLADIRVIHPLSHMACISIVATGSVKTQAE